MKKQHLYIFLFLLPIVLIGQQTTQTIELRPGWNSIYLELTPSPSKCEVVFADIPIQSVWALAKQFNTRSELGLDWLIYHPQQASLTELYQLQGGKSYLIELKGDEKVTLELEGKPILPKINWAADTFSLAGFHVAATDAPTFAAFFEDVPALANNEVLEMDAEGNWQPIHDLTSHKIEKGISYWIKSDEVTDFTAPIRLHTEQENCLVFGTALTEENLRIENTSYRDKQVQLIPKAAAYSRENLGKVPLLYWDTNTSNWEDFSDGMPLNVAARSTQFVRIGIDRTKMRKGVYQSILEVSDGEGTQLSVPVSAKGLNDRSGLWVGYASVNAVSYVNAVEDVPQPTASDFQLRLIIHVDDTGNARMLDQVIQMWKNGVYNEQEQRVEEAGAYVLITDDELVSQYTGATLRDGKAVGRRLSTPHFSFREPQLMTGDFETELRLDSIFIGFDDPLNPFKHRYHPDHNNLDERYENQLPEGRESYDILRAIKLTFSEDDPEGLNITGWGDNQVGGTYEESIQGIHRQTLKVSGIFRLRRVSTINRLNEEPNPAVPNLNLAVPQKLQAKKLEVQSTPMDQLTVQPNPTSDQLYIQGLNIGTYRIRIFTLEGKLLRETFISASDAINVSHLAAGNYFLEVFDGTQMTSLKFVKQGN